MSVPPVVPSEPSVVEITFVDLQPSTAPQAEIEPREVEPSEEVQVTNRVEEDLPVEPDRQIPDLEFSAPKVPDNDSAILEVLVRLEAEQAQLEIASPGGDSPADTIGPDEVATVLRRFSCEGLTGEQKENCPKSNPFAIAEVRAARDSLARNPTPISIDIRMNVVEEFFARQKQDRHMFPGMNADMFVDTLPPGVYDAERIRSGGEPLWNGEMKRRFSTGE